jgi:hypothetical protein
MAVIKFVRDLFSLLGYLCVLAMLLVIASFLAWCLVHVMPKM